MGANRIYSTFKSLLDVGWSGITDGRVLIRSGTSVSQSKVILTQPAGSSTLTIADGKTLTVNNTITFSGTDGTTHTLPSTSQTLAGLGVANTWTAAQTFSGQVSFPNSSGVNTSGDATFRDILTGLGRFLILRPGHAVFSGTSNELSLGGYSRVALTTGTSSGTSSDPAISRNGNALVIVDGAGGNTSSLQLGANHATAGTAQTIKAHNVTTGTGASLTIAGGTGSTAGGAVILATSATTGAATAVLTCAASGIATFAGAMKLASYTVATVPSASTVGAGGAIYVSDEAGGAVIAQSNGTNWQRLTDLATIS